MWTKLKKIVTKKIEVHKTMFENLLNHYISKLYTSNLVSDILASGPVAPRINISVMYCLIGI